MKKDTQVQLITEYKELNSSGSLIATRYIVEITNDFICHRYFFDKQLEAVKARMAALKRYGLLPNQQNTITD